MTFYNRLNLCPLWHTGVNPRILYMIYIIILHSRIDSRVPEGRDRLGEGGGEGGGDLPLCQEEGGRRHRLRGGVQQFLRGATEQLCKQKCTV